MTYRTVPFLRQLLPRRGGAGPRAVHVPRAGYRLWADATAQHCLHTGPAENGETPPVAVATVTMATGSV